MEARVYRLLNADQATAQEENVQPNQSYLHANLQVRPAQADNVVVLLSAI